MRTCTVEGCIKPLNCRGVCTLHYHRLTKYGAPTGGPPRLPPTRDVLRDLMLIETDECVIWPRAIGGGGYGSVTIDGRLRRTNMVACESRHGPRPTPDHKAAHWCGNPACVNPRHIRWATHSENMMDRVQHGTHARGERSSRAKLTLAQATEILRTRGIVSAPELARRFNVSTTTVSSVRSRQSWAWLDDYVGTTV